MFEKEVMEKIEGLNTLDILNLSPEEIEKSLDFLVPLYMDTKSVLSRFSLVCEFSTLTSIDDLLERVETIVEWQGLLEHYDDSAVFIFSYLTNLKTIVSDEIEDKKLEAQFEDTSKTAGMTATDRRKYGAYITKDLNKKKSEIGKALSVWEALKGQLRKKAGDLKTNLQTLKSLIHSYEVRPEIMMTRAERAKLSEEERLKNLNSVKNKYINKGSENGDTLEDLLGDFEVDQLK